MDLEDTAAAASAQLPANPSTTATTNATPPPPRFPPIPVSVSTPVSSDELRALVLDYLTHTTYLDSAVAFVKGWQQSSLSTDGEPSTSSSSSGAAGPSKSATMSRRSGASEDLSALAEEPGILADDEDMHDATVTAPFELDVDDVDAADHGGPAYRNGDSDSFDSPHLRKEEIRLIRVRKEIKRLVRQGAIQAGIDMCNLHFPSVLSPPASSSSSSTPKKAVSSTSRTSTAGTPRPSSHLSTKPSNMSLSSSSGSTATPSSISFSTQPLLLSLALQIQLFIEIIRSSSSGSSSSPPAISRPSTPLSSASNGYSSMENSTSSLTSNASNGSAMSGISGTSSSANGSTSALSMALSHAQSLHAQANKLADPGIKNIYLRELESVSGLLPYRDPRMSPVAYYLDEGRREGLAEAVNGAILLSLGRTSTNSKLEDLVKQNEVIWRSLNDLKVNFPPETGANKNKAQKSILPFSMQEFLDTRVLPEP